MDKYAYLLALRADLWYMNTTFTEESDHESDCFIIRINQAKRHQKSLISMDS